jgi:hypothetical protein
MIPSGATIANIAIVVFISIAYTYIWFYLSISTKDCYTVTKRYCIINIWNRDWLVRVNFLQV